MAEELYAQLAEDYNRLSKLSQAQKLTDEEVFALIAEMDKRYGGLPSHFFSFDGIISNIGHDQASVKVLNYAIKRLKAKVEIDNSNKLIYDLATTILAKADVSYTLNKSMNWLVDNVSMYHEARSIFFKVIPDDLNSYEQASTNIANILEKLGRNYEALYMYDRAIKHNQSFGMAFGNKAIALEYYIRLSPQLSLALAHEVYLLYNKAVKDPYVLDIGGEGALKFFQDKLEAVEAFLKKAGYDQSQMIKAPKISKYYKFILENNLFLNYDFGYYYDSSSLKDIVFPTLVESVASERYEKNGIMSRKVYFCFQVFNQLLEDFTTARYNFYRGMHNQYKGYDKCVNYVYAMDYTRHSLKYGLLKSVFSMLCNCLDKVAHLVRYYLDENEIVEISSSTYFDWFTTSAFKNIIIKYNNFQLLALMSLALDFKDGGVYYRFKRIRNRVTHSFINVNVGIGYNEAYDTFEITEDDLIDQLKQLFVVVKSAILYAVIGISKCSPAVTNGQMGTMTATMQSQIFRQ